MRIINRLTLGILGNHTLVRKYMKLPNGQTPLSPFISFTGKFFSFFKDCQGAVDGTQIPFTIPSHLAKPYFNRKNQITQIVLEVCDFGMNFTYLLTGWAGSTADSRLWDVAQSKGLAIPPGKYLLGDSGFALTNSCMTPYKGIRYHLKYWSDSGNM